MNFKRDTLSSSSSSPLLLLFLIVLPVTLGQHSVARGTGEDAEGDSKKLLDQVLTGVERAMDFFAQDYSSINVDGLFGMRVAQGQLLEAKEACESSGSCPEGLQRRLQAVVDRIETAAQAALQYVKAEDEEYYARFVQVVDRPYRLPYAAVTLQDLQSTPPGSDPSYDEELGDACLSRVMGTFVDEALGRAVDRCNVTDVCWTYMTAQGSSKYAITHQLLYLSFIQKNGCTQRVEAAMNAQVAHAQARMCGAIYNEAVSEVEDNKVADILQDLFLEQVIVCGTLGYENILRSDWMRMVLTWQKASGCFSVDDMALLLKEKLAVKAEEEERQIMADLKHEALVMEQRQSTGRKLLRERMMKDGCLAHKSGLGFGAMGVFVRYLLQQDYAA